MCRFLSLVILLHLSLTISPLSAKANEPRRYSPPVAPASQVHDAPSPIKNKASSFLNDRELLDFAVSLVAKYTVEDGRINFSDYTLGGSKGDDGVGITCRESMRSETCLDIEKMKKELYTDDKRFTQLPPRSYELLKSIFDIPNVDDPKLEDVYAYYSTVNTEFSSSIDELLIGTCIYWHQKEKYYWRQKYRGNVRGYLRQIHGDNRLNCRDYYTGSMLGPEQPTNSARHWQHRNYSARPNNKRGGEHSLEYDIDHQTIRNKFISLDFSILETDICVGDKCLSEKVKKTVTEIISSGEGITVYPLFDKKLFDIPEEELFDELKYHPDFNSITFIPDKGSSAYTTSLNNRVCGKENDKKYYACIEEKILLEYTGPRRDNMETSISFLLFSNLRNVFIDAINITLRLSINDGEDGEAKVIISDIRYDNIAKPSFPRKLNNKHTLVVLKGKKNTHFALISKGKTDEDKLELTSWKEKTAPIENFITNEKEEFFRKKSHFISHYSNVLKTLVMSKVKDNDVFKTESCDGKRSIEVVYPNQKNNEISPITIEYLTTDKRDNQFVGECYLVSHRPAVTYSSGGKIQNIHIYLNTDEQRTDGAIQNIVTEFDKLQKEYTFEQNPQECVATDIIPGIVTAKNCSVLQLKDSDGTWQPVYWHKDYPDKAKNHDNSLLIFNGHHVAGVFSFNDETPILYGNSFGFLNSPNYLLNACGSEKYPLNKIMLNSKFRNLIYANKPILPEEAAISMACSIENFMQIPSGKCRDMSTWMRGVRKCMKDKLGTKQLNELAFHLLGQMGEDLCRK